MSDFLKNNYKILILSNPDNHELIDDINIAKSFKNDGNKVDIKWIDYDESLDKYYDIIIRRNTWVEDIKATDYFYIKNTQLIQRLKNKNIKTANLEGLDGQGKKYLCKLFNEGKKVIPTVDNIVDISKLGATDQYILKDSRSFGSGICQKTVKIDEISKYF